jgi:hypothetical protein
VRKSFESSPKFKGSAKSAKIFKITDCLGKSNRVNFRFFGSPCGRKVKVFKSSQVRSLDAEAFPIACRTYSMSELIRYTTEDGRNQIKLWARDQTVWLSQREMAQLFDVSADNVGLHLKNLFEDGELNRQGNAGLLRDCPKSANLCSHAADCGRTHHSSRQSQQLTFRAVHLEGRQGAQARHRDCQKSPDQR